MNYIPTKKYTKRITKAIKEQKEGINKDENKKQ